MGFYASLDRLYKNIRQSRPELTEAQVRAEAERYLKNALQPRFSEEETMDMLEDEDRRREGTPPRKLPRYSSSERKERREKAAKIRQGMYNFFTFDESDSLDPYRYNLNKGGTSPNAPGLTDEQRQEIRNNGRSYKNREEQRIFRYIPPNASPEERRRLESKNEEIAFIFDTNEEHWEQYYAENIALLRNSGDPSYANRSDAELRAELEESVKVRRGQLIMERLHEAHDMLDSLEDMSDPSLSGEQLATNYMTLMQAMSLCYEADNYVSNFENGRSIVSEADMQFTRDMKQFQGRYSMAVNRISAQGNPISEMVDIGNMVDIDTTKLYFHYESEMEETEEGRDFQQEREEKHTHWQAYAGDGKVRENLDNLIDDAEEYMRKVTRSEIELTFKDVVERNGFTLGEGGARITCEHFDRDGSKSIKEIDCEKLDRNGNKVLKRDAGADELTSGRPLVLEQDGRVAVLSLRHTTSCEMVWDKPEKLFNYSLQYENETLMAQMKASDKWYQTSSDAFKEMRESFENVTKATKNGLTGDAQQRTALTAQYDELLAKTNAYLDKKQREGVGDGHNPLEQGHIAVARKLKKYAEEKLNDLHTVDKARFALERYAGMSAKEIQKATRRDHYNEQQKAEREDMAQWLKDRVNEFPGDLPMGFLMEAKNRAIMMGPMLNVDRDEEAVDSVYTCSERTQDFACMTVGCIVAAEMVKNEREQRRAEGKEGPGAFEKRMQTDYRAIARELGEAAAKYTVGEPQGEEVELPGDEKLKLMTNAQFTEFLTTFHPEELATEMPEARTMPQRAEEAVRAEEERERQQREAEERERQQREAAERERQQREAEEREQAAREAVDEPLRNEMEKLGKVGLGVHAFANDNIAPKIDDLRTKLAAGEKTCEAQEAMQLMSNCVILGMMQLEELSGGSNLRNTLRSPAAMEALQTEVKKTEEFADLWKEVAAPDGRSASIEGISRALVTKGPLGVARDILENALVKQTPDNNMRAHSAELNREFKLGDKPPVNEQSKPSVM